MEEKVNLNWKCRVEGPPCIRSPSSRTEFTSRSSSSRRSSKKDISRNFYSQDPADEEEEVSPLDNDELWVDRVEAKRARLESSPGSSSRKAGSSSFVLPNREPPPTPMSNFSISVSGLSSDSESGSESQSVANDVGRMELEEEDSRRTRPSRGEAVGTHQGEGQTNSESYARSLGTEMRSLFGNRGSIHSEVILRRRQALEGPVDDDDGMCDTVMAAVWANGKLGMAYYELESTQMFLLPDTAETAPDFMVLRALYKQILPRYMVISSRQDERMLNVVHELCGDKITGGNENDNESDAASGNEMDRSQLYLLNGKDFILDICKQRMVSLRLPYESKDSTPEDHMIFISSLIPFRNETMIRAAGGLLRFMDRSSIELFQLDLIDGHVPVLDVKISSMDDIVMVDDSAWKSLQIFSVDMHPSAVKQGNHSGSKEGLSIFGMLNHCSTLQGARALRLMLLRPSRNRAVLNRRHEVIELCNHPRFSEFVKSAVDCLKAIKSLPKLLYKLSLLHASVAEWKDLYQTIYHGLILAEMCRAQPDTTELLSELANEENLQVLKSLSQEMMRVIDFDESVVEGRIVARPGIDPVLDLKKKQYNALPDVMALVSREEMLNLPGYVNQCSVVYIPEVGYLLAVSLWHDDLTAEDVELEGMEFKFKTNELAYYKSPRTNELDAVVGDCSVSILEKETSIVIFLTECIIKASNQLLKIGSLISEFDCLISMALVARSNGFVRPDIVGGETQLEIEGGRHPLMEVMCDFVPNNTKFEGDERVAILTGPNASGKSIYLKQVGIIAIMGLSGSFVPANRARIPAFDRICTRIHATESLSTGFSSYMTDLAQMATALTVATRQSLVIVDEFGKGTAEADGLALLAASIEDFTRRGINSPTLILSTHFYSLMKYMKVTPLVKLQSMKFMQEESDESSDITYLYELVDGTCQSSFAKLVAEQSGVPKAIVERSGVMENVVRGQRSLRSIQPQRTSDQVVESSGMLRIADEFLSLRLGSVDARDYLARLKSIFDERQDWQ